jgi:phytoene desaturase
MKRTNNSSQKAIVIGAGLGGLAMAALLAERGYAVTVLEKNDQLGGRAGLLKVDGFTFDTGPSWYLMPEVFEHFFELFGEKVSDYLDLIKLDPSYRIFFKDSGLAPVDITGRLEEDIPKFEALEPGVTPRLRDYLKRSEYQYKVAMGGFVYKNYDSIKDFLSLRMAVEGTKLRVFMRMEKYVKRFFKSDAVQKIMQYTLVFLGSSPYNTPALYSIMSHVDFNVGVFYPRGGIYELTKALEKLGKKRGVEYRCNAPVQQIVVDKGEAKAVILADGTELTADIVVSNGDIHHTEMQLLPEEARSFTADYWKKRVLAPSGFMLYLGVEGRIPSLTHHNLIFCRDWKENFGQIFDTPHDLPTDPSFYVCAPSVTDDSVAPKNMENLFVLVPIAANLKLSQEQLDRYEDQILATMEREMGVENLRSRIVVKRRASGDDFAKQFNSLGGTALGLAHTLSQTAIFRPNTVSKKVRNLYYVGANTNPGIGMPMVLISAELVLKRLMGDTSAEPLDPAKMKA